MNDPSRRELLAASGAVFGSLIAGCIDDSDQSTARGTTPPPNTVTPTPESTPDETRTPTTTRPPADETEVPTDEETEPTTDEPATETPTRDGVAWAFDLGAAIDNPPAFADGVVYVGGWRETYGTPTPGGDHGQSNVLVALDAETGEQDWEYDAGAPIQTRPRVAGDTVYLIRGFDGLHGHDYQVRGLSTEGEEQWVHETPPLKFLNVLGADERGIYVGTRDDNLGGGNERVTAISPGGDVQWHHDYGDASGGAITAESVYAVDFGGRVRAIDRTDGESLWTHEAESLYLRRAAVVGDAVVTIGDHVFALDRADGSVAWRFDDVKSRQFVVGDGRVFVVGGDRVHAVDAADGTEQWTVETGTSPGLAVADGTLYVIRPDGQTTAHDAEDGETHWEAALDDGGTLKPGDEHVYAIAENGDTTAVTALAKTDGTRELTVELDGSPAGVATHDSRAVVAAESGTVYGLRSL